MPQLDLFIFFDVAFMLNFFLIFYVFIFCFFIMPNFLLYLKKQSWYFFKISLLKQIYLKKLFYLVSGKIIIE